MAKVITRDAKPFSNSSMDVETPTGTMDYSTLPQHAVHYLVQYGINKSLQDSVAGRAKAMVADGLEEDEIEQALGELRAARWEAILSGTIGKRGVMAPRAKGIDKVMKEIAIERLRAAFTKRGIAMAKGTQLAELVAKLMTRDENELRQAAQERLDATLSMSDGLDDLFDTDEED